RLNVPDGVDEGDAELLAELDGAAALGLLAQQLDQQVHLFRDGGLQPGLPHAELAQLLRPAGFAGPQLPGHGQRLRGQLPRRHVPRRCSDRLRHALVTVGPHRRAADAHLHHPESGARGRHAARRHHRHSRERDHARGHR
ncbi:MAG: hypothetical protein ACK559_30430, partial [bacterium]